MPRIYSPIHTFCTAKADTGAGTEFKTEPYSRIVLQITGATSTNATLKVQGALPDATVTWGGAAAAANPAVYLGFKNMDARALVAGSTGIAVGSDSAALIELDTQAIGKINIHISAISAGAVTVKGWGVSEL
jgi:hypothetical protein